MFDGTFKKAGEHSAEYSLEMDNGARAIVRTYGGNAFSYITKDGVEVMGKRKDAPNPIADTKPYAGGAPHCFPQFGPGAIMQHGVSIRNANPNKLHNGYVLTAAQFLYAVCERDEVHSGGTREETVLRQNDLQT